jgi:hypothetical protein
MKLKFEPYEFGFSLKNSIPIKNLKEDDFIDVSPHIDFLVTKEGEVAFVNWPFLKNPIQELELEISFLKKNHIPGQYEVPELNLKNATFVEVLESVKRYYEKNLRRKHNEKIRRKLGYTSHD